MDKKFLSDTGLFRGMKAGEVESLLECLKVKKRTFKKGEVIFRVGQTTSSMGLVVSGVVSVEIDDVWGNKNIWTHASAGQVFGETYACLPGEPMLVSAVAAEDAEVMFLNAGRLMKVCPKNCPYHGKLIQNLLAIASQKNINLSRRMTHLAARSIRGRVSSYLSFEAVQRGSREFTIPYNRQQLADYLNVDRSALSNELSKMQKEGLLRTEKNYFCLSEEAVSEHLF